MRKAFKYLVFIFVLSFIFIKGASAKVLIENDCKMSNDNSYEDCKVSLVIESSEVNIVKMHFDLVNLKFDNYKSINDDFKINLDKTNLTLKYDAEYIGDVIPDGKYELFTMRLYKDKLSENCGFTPYIDEATHESRTCTFFEGYYIDKSGNKSKTKTEQYRIDCEKITCEKVGDKYFDSEGNEVSKDEYSADCEKHTCEYIGGYYFDKDGKKVTLDEFEASCSKKVCYEENGKYYDNEGKEVTKENYDKACGVTYTCKKVNDKYYGKDGKVVTEDIYKKECLPICEIKSGKYYDKNGKEVTKEEYEIACKEHKCSVIGNKYFNNKGKEVTKKEYEEACVVKYYCIKKGDTYYDKNGKKVSESEYNKSCGISPKKKEKENPETGVAVPIVLISSFLIGGSAVYFITNRKKKFNKI